MRVTHKQMADSFAANFFRQTEQLYRAQERLATQKRINRPSDDPVGMGKVLDYRAALRANEQYQRNIERARSHVETSEKILETVDDLLVEAKGIAGEQASGAGDAAMLQVAAQQVETIRGQLFDLGNSKIGDRFLFAGRNSGDPAFERDVAGVVSYVGDATADSDMRYLVGQGVTVGVEANGATVFNGSEDVFALLEDLGTELQQADPDADAIGDVMGRLQGVIDGVRAVRAGNGAVHQRLKATEGQLKRFALNLDNLRGREEDLDVAQAAVELQSLETSYQVSLATAARVIQPSLVDFLG